MAADVGTLQRLPKAIGSQSLARELCLTGRKFLSKEAHASGLVSKVMKTTSIMIYLKYLHDWFQVFADKDTLINGAIELAETIASMSPIAVQATKQNMVYSLDHTNQEGLDQIVRQNSKWYVWLYTTFLISAGDEPGIFAEWRFRKCCDGTNF